MTILVILAVNCYEAFASGAPRVVTNKNVYNHGEKIKVHYYNAPGYANDWICIVPHGAKHSQSGTYQYARKRGDGVLTFKASRSGKYEVRAYFNYSPGKYIVSASHDFTVQ
jgi:hypothetical protein